MIRLRSLSVLFLLVAACGGERSSTERPATTSTPPPAAVADQTFTLYSGRNEKLIRPLLDKFTADTGIKVEARFGESSELAATLLEEGQRTPADVFLSQDAAGLGAVAKAGLARPLPQDVVSMVPSRFASADGRWIGVSGRARTVVYNPKRIKPAQLPRSLEAAGEPRYRGKFGVAPPNASFQSHMAAYGVVNGPAALDKLLAAMVKNEPRRYPRNGAIVDAVASGEIDWGLVNHYYVWEARKENPDAPVENFFMPEGEGSSFVNVAGVAQLADDPDAAVFIRYLLSEPAQRYFAEQTYEYPLVAGVQSPVALQSLDQIRTPPIDFARVSEALPETLKKIAESGLSRQ